MCFRLVSIDHEYQLDLPFEVHVEDRLCQLMGNGDEAALHEKSRKVLSQRLVDLITAMLDGDLLPPTEKQVKYAVAIARELLIELPPEALRYREAMTVFLGRHAESYRDSKKRRPPLAKA